ncbi:MAG: serine protein kinase RIO [Thermoplasmata archaeon]|nr:serine protein kinase RIO [Thermoplasmata archaeon]MCI4332529.1 serine protein kinase RIO [Thermoplasmata archaeon]
MADVEEQLFPKRKERFEDRRKESQQRKLLDEFFDHATLVAISRLVTQGQFDQLDYPISTGKEGGVFRATSGEVFRAVKVYRIGNAVFKRLPAYALEMLKREASTSNYGRLVTGWTRREHSVLHRLYDAGVRCPRPFGYLRNVLVMDFVGDEGLPAPRLQTIALDDPQAVHDDMVVQVRLMVQKARLVHADLSPYNVLFHGGKPVVIDVAQSIEAEHPQAKALLERDVANFAKYFRRLGVPTSPETFMQAVGPLELGPKGG